MIYYLFYIKLERGKERKKEKVIKQIYRLVTIGESE